MGRKIKVNNAIDVMHYKSVELIQSIKQDIDEYRMRIEENIIKNITDMSSVISETAIYHENSEFRTLYETIEGTAKHLKNAINNVVDSRQVPFVRTDFSNLLNKYQNKGKVQDDELKFIITDILKNFHKNIENEINKFIQYLHFLIQQISEKKREIQSSLFEYNKLNKLIPDKFDEEVKALYSIDSLLEKYLQTISKIIQDISTSELGLTKYIDTFQKSFINDVYNQNFSLVQVITNALQKIFNKKIEKIEDPGEIENHDLFKSTMLDANAKKERKKKLREDTRNIENVPLPDYTSAQNSNNAEVKVDFPYANKHIAEMCLEWLKSKYKSKKMKLSILKIEKKCLIIMINFSEQVPIQELHNYKDEITRDVLSTIQTIIARKRIELKIRKGLSESYLRKLIPKLAPSNSNLDFILYDVQTGSICVEYMSTHNEVDTFNKNILKQIFKKYRLC